MGWVLHQDKHIDIIINRIDIIILSIYNMGFFTKKTWSEYFKDLGNTVSKGTTDTLNGATSIANDAAKSIDATTGSKLTGGRRGTRRRRGTKSRSTKSRRNRKLSARRN